ncbi:site-2 protease family protein [Ascidiimonas sp. W6]|uniref:site-2 protease family protein n=1 Tax=Ascidiimonas meishanensis TaxID=3128903 RepID=UPI0030EEB5C2
MKGILKLGKVSDIRIEVHWTFIFLIVWIVFLELNRGGTIHTILTNILFILILFTCVVLHELGHALTAKNFNIKTEKITLLPIGGVASLEKMPEKPSEELKVAIAGPLVNLAIALVLLIVFPIEKYFNLSPDKLIEFVSSGSFDSFIFNMLLANLVLIVFNLIPAFPMDGGRVLRALLAMRMKRSKATEIAAGLGQILAVLFFILGILYNPFLVLIALFIFMGAFQENKIEQQLSVVKDYKVKDAMLTHFTLVNQTHTVEYMISLILAGTEKHFMVVDDQDSLIGVIHFKDILKHANQPDLQIRDLFHKNFKTIHPEDALPEVLRLITATKENFFPVLDKNTILGALDPTNLNEFILLTAKINDGSSS